MRMIIEKTEWNVTEAQRCPSEPKSSSNSYIIYSSSKQEPYKKNYLLMKNTEEFSGEKKINVRRIGQHEGKG